MNRKVVKEAVERIPGLPTFSRIHNQIVEKLNIRISENELEEFIDEMIEDGELEERQTTIKGNSFKGYKLTVEDDEKEEEEEERSEEEKVIDEVFGRSR